MLRHSLALVLFLLVASTLGSRREYFNCFKSCDRKYFNQPKQLASCLHECKQAEAASSEDQTPKAAVDPETAWLQYRDALINALTARSASNSRIQIFTIPEEASWDMNSEQFTQLADNVPYASGFYERSGYTVRSQYKSFLNNINAGRRVVDQSAKAELDKLQTQFNSDSQSIRDERMACWMQFAKSGSNQNLADYEKKSCPKYAAAQARLVEAQWLIEFYNAQAYGTDNIDLSEARFASDNIDSMTFSELSGSLAEFRKQCQSGGGTSLKLDVSLTNSKSRREDYAKYTNGIRRPSSMTGSLFTMITGDSAKGVTTTTDQFKMSLNFKAWKKIDIRPGSWLKKSVIERYKSGPWIHASAAKNFFGSGGTMTLLPKSIYLAYKPTMSLHINKKDEFNLRDSVKKGKSGFFSSKSTEAKIETKIESADSLKVTISSNSDSPMIIAMDFYSLPNFN